MGVVAEGETLRLSRDGVSFPVCIGPRQAALRPYNGREVIIGLRPEHIHEQPAGGAEEVAFPARVEVIEPLGSEAYLYADVAGTQMIARISPATPARPDQQITLWADVAALHAFDPDTEANILLAGVAHAAGV